MIKKSKKHRSKNSHQNKNAINPETELIDISNDKNTLFGRQESNQISKIEIEIAFCHPCKRKKMMFVNSCGCRLCNTCTVDNIINKRCKKC